MNRHRTVMSVTFFNFIQIYVFGFAIDVSLRAKFFTKFTYLRIYFQL